MVPRGTSASPPWEPPSKRKNKKKMNKVSWTPKGCVPTLRPPSWQKQSGTARQTRQSLHHTIQYRKQGAQHRRHPPNTGTRKGGFQGRDGDAVGHRPLMSFNCRGNRNRQRLPIAIASARQSQHAITTYLSGINPKQSREFVWGHGEKTQSQSQKITSINWSCGTHSRGKKSIHHHRGTPLFSVCRPTPRSQSKKNYGVYHSWENKGKGYTPQVRKKGIHLRPGKRKKDGFHGGGVFFFSAQ